MPSDTKRHQQTPGKQFNVNRSRHASLNSLLGWDRLLVSFDVCWFLLVSVLVLICPEIPGGGDWENMGNSVSMFMGLGCVHSVLKCSGLVWCNKCSILEMHQQTKLRAPDTFKHQNTKTSLKIIWLLQMKITIYSFLGSPCV